MEAAGRQPNFGVVPGAEPPCDIPSDFAKVVTVPYSSIKHDQLGLRQDIACTESVSVWLSLLFLLCIMMLMRCSGKDGFNHYQCKLHQTGLNREFLG